MGSTKPLGQRTVFRDKYREVPSHLDVLEDLSMTRWLIGLLALFGTLITALLAVAQFTG